jgi:dihydropteroate synthase
MQNSVIKNHVFAGGLHIMGVVNVTPDSFSDGSRFLNADLAIAHGLKLVQDGATILDVGGESSRPGAQEIDAQEEIERIVPVIEGLRGAVPFISVDTRHAKTMEAALRAGANIFNDISAFTHDSESIHVAAQAGVPIILMHMQGTPETMQNNPMYNNVVTDVFEYLKQRIEFCGANRIEISRVVVDPGIGFGKSVEHNLLLLKNIRKFHDLGVPIMLGTSRKGFIAKLSKDENPDERVGGSLASVLWGLSQGVQIFRVHDVKETAQAIKIYSAISDAGS